MDSYSIFRAMHLTGAVLLLGNVTVTGVWSWYLFRRFQEGVMPFRPIARAILWTDLIFTAGGGALLTASGIVMAIKSGLPLLQTPWLLKGVIALSTSTLIWLVLLLPDQFRLEKAQDPAVIRRLYLRWTLIGWAVTLVLFYGLWAMATRR